MNKEEKKEELENPIRRGNGSMNDSLADLGDIILKTDKKNEKSQNKSFIWTVISVTISFLVLILTIVSLWFK